jgi:hypothetical protein
MVPAAFQIRKIVQASVTTTLITRIGQAMCRVALPAGCAVNSVRDTTLGKIGRSETQGACGTVTDWALADIKTPGKSGQLRSCRRRAMFTENYRDSVGANGRSNPPALSHDGSKRNSRRTAGPACRRELNRKTRVAPAYLLDRLEPPRRVAECARDGPAGGAEPKWRAVLPKDGAFRRVAESGAHMVAETQHVLVNKNSSKISAS